MIVVKIKGGLGNQLFEYAMARKLQLDLGQDQIVLDIARVNADELRNFELGNFGLYENTVILQNAERGWISRFQEDAAKRIVSYCIAGRPEYVAAAREKKLENFFGLFGIVQRDHFEGNHKICFLKFHKHIYINGWFQNAQVPMSIRDILISDLMGIGKNRRRSENAGTDYGQNNIGMCPYKEGRLCKPSVVWRNMYGTVLS